eukprot:CAMPEP_0184504468 /NCGR_PEP_ID=MMETSP0113_2-20130426/52483_1 /TAXON_ID=91329 /ORGANISM="Norrisiella sphaerica, Strain BC52" /LENGTH=1781 /DNA_ID=CAMNT_0026894117 /DNA_START=805 /DNA_END=6151 /DNA_ORIENTATION=-
MQSPTENKTQRKKKWFEKKEEKESRKMEKKSGSMIDFMFGGDTLKKLKSVVQGATGPEAEAKVMYELMRVVKTEEGRNLFAYKLDPDRMPAKTVQRRGSTVIIKSRKTFEFLSVILKAALREGYYTRDFKLNKTLMDVSYYYIYIEEGNQSCMNLYSEIAHETTFSESMEYWEAAFVELERVINPLRKDAELEVLKGVPQENTEGSKKAKILEMISVFLPQMIIFSDTAVDFAFRLAERVCLMFDISDQALQGLREKIASYVQFRSRFEPVESTRTSSFVESKYKAPRTRRKRQHSMADVHVKLDGILLQSEWVRHRTEAGIFFHNRETNEISDFPPPNSIFEDHINTDLPSPPGPSKHGREFSYLFQEIKLGYIPECWKQTKVGQTAIWEQEGAKFRSVKGAILVTNFRVEFTCSEMESLMNEVIPVHAMERFEHDIFTVTTAIGMQQEMQVMVFHTKDYRTLRVTAPYSEELAKLLKRIKKLAFPKKDARLFAFRFRQPVAHADDGWGIYNIEREFQRQGALISGWRMADINRLFTFSPTYPQRVAVPNFASDRDLVTIAKFRSKRRLPVLTFYLARKGAAMLRSSQPLVGLTGNRGKEEEQMLQELKITAIFDARPTENAFANKAKGGGYEDTRYYSRKGEAKCEIFFCDIHNIHRMRASLSHLILACEQQVSRRSDEFWELCLRSRWVSHVRNLVLQSYRLASTLVSGRSVLVHCSDGWDRTAQMVSLAQICLDPYYRTIEGLAVLIEKDWCSFGHQFHKRVGHGSPKFSDSDRSPIFVQFLDALWQLWTQAPERFEYNEKMLEYLAQELVSCKFGTFLYDNEKTRCEKMIKQNTVSIWTYVCKSHKSQFVNPLYAPSQDKACLGGTLMGAHTVRNAGLIASDAQNEGYLKLNTDPRHFKVWPYYFRQDLTLVESLHGTGWVADHILKKDRTKAKLQTEWLKARVAALEEKLRESERVNKELAAVSKRETASSRTEKHPGRLVKHAPSIESWREKSINNPTTNASSKSVKSLKSVKSSKSVKSVKSSKSVKSAASGTMHRVNSRVSVASSTQEMPRELTEAANSAASPNNESKIAASSVHTGAGAVSNITAANTQIERVGSLPSVGNSSHWVPIRRPLPGIPASSSYQQQLLKHQSHSQHQQHHPQNSEPQSSSHHHLSVASSSHEQARPQPSETPKTTTTQQTPWEEKQSVTSAMGIAPTVNTAKTFGSDIIDQESPRSTSPNPSTALPSHRSHSPTEINSVMAVGDHREKSDDHGVLSSHHNATPVDNNWELVPPSQHGRVSLSDFKAKLSHSASHRATVPSPKRSAALSRPKPPPPPPTSRKQKNSSETPMRREPEHIPPSLRMSATSRRVSSQREQRMDGQENAREIYIDPSTQSEEEEASANSKIHDERKGAIVIARPRSTISVSNKVMVMSMGSLATDEDENEEQEVDAAEEGEEASHKAQTHRRKPYDDEDASGDDRRANSYRNSNSDSANIDNRNDGNKVTVSMDSLVAAPTPPRDDAVGLGKDILEEVDEVGDPRERESSLHNDDSVRMANDSMHGEIRASRSMLEQVDETDSKDVYSQKNERLAAGSKVWYEVQEEEMSECEPETPFFSNDRRDDVEFFQAIDVKQVQKEQSLKASVLKADEPQRPSRSCPPPPPSDTDEEDSESDVEQESLRSPDRASFSSEGEPRRSSTLRKRADASAFDWSATIKPSTLGNIKDFFISVKRSTVASKPGLAKARLIGGQRLVDEKEGVPDSKASDLSVRNSNSSCVMRPPPPPESDCEESDVSS